VVLVTTFQVWNSRKVSMDGLQVQTVTGDVNCLFQSILLDDEEQCSKLRQKAVQ
jgi:hypothetical protein